jgi:hypothetical protein
LAWGHRLRSAIPSPNDEGILKRGKTIRKTEIIEANLNKKNELEKLIIENGLTLFNWTEFGIGMEKVEGSNGNRRKMDNMEEEANKISRELAIQNE